MNETAVKGANEKLCSECGQLINVKAEICPKRGVRQMGATTSYGAMAPNGKSRLAAALFAIFLGGIGIHNLGKLGQGHSVSSLLDINTSVIGVIDGIVYL